MLPVSDHGQATATDPTRVIVIIPTYNERGNIVTLVPAVLSYGYRVLVVDDNSPDGTGDVADAFALTYHDPGSGYCIRPPDVGSATPTPTRFAMSWRATRRSSVRWMRTGRTTRSICPIFWRR